MSDLDVLEEIAEQTAFGTGGQNTNGARGHRSGRPRREFCGAGHPQNEENTRLYKQGKRIRSVCRICDASRATKKRRVKYSAREYPL